MNSSKSAFTSIQIILKLAEISEGKRKRKDFVASNKKGGKEVKDLDILSEKVKEKHYDKSGHPLKDGEASIAAESIDKSLNLLKKRKLIEPIRIYEGGRRYAGYRLRCKSLYDLAEIFNYIYDAETKSSDYYKGFRLFPDSSGFERLKRFVTSEFFYDAMSLYIFDLIYYFNLWDARKYRLSKEGCKKLISKEGKFKHIPKEPSILYFNPFSGPDIPGFFRKFLQNEGPALYESYLKQNMIHNIFLRNLGLFPAGEKTYLIDAEVFEEVLNLFRFFRKPLKISPATEELAVDLLDYWFNNFWYIGLSAYVSGVESMRYEDSIIPKGELTKKVCILDPAKMRLGMHSFPNAFTIRELFYKYDIPFPNFILLKYPVYRMADVKYASISNGELTFHPLKEDFENSN